MWFPIERTNTPITCQSPLNASFFFFLACSGLPKIQCFIQRVQYEAFKNETLCVWYIYHRVTLQEFVSKHSSDPQFWEYHCILYWVRREMTIFSWKTMIIIWLHCISLYNYILIISGCARKSLCERHGSRRLHLKSEGDLAKGQKGKVDYTGLPHCQKQDHMICTATIGVM